MNTLSKIFLFLLLGLVVAIGYIYFFIYRPEHLFLVKQKEKIQADLVKEKEDNKILIDSLSTIKTERKQDSIVYVYKTEYVKVNTKTNEAIKTFTTSVGDSTKISVFSELLRDTSFKEGSYNSNRTKSN